MLGGWIVDFSKLLKSCLLLGVLYLSGCETLYKIDRGRPPNYLPPPARPRDPQIVNPLAEEIADYKVSRRIAMYYRIDLKKHNYFSSKVAQSLKAYDEPVRQCYTSRIDANPNLRGKVTFVFAMSKQTGAIDKIAKESGDLQDPTVINCLKQQMAKIPFKPPQDMLGRIQYNFDYVDDQAPVARAKK